MRAKKTKSSTKTKTKSSSAKAKTRKPAKLAKKAKVTRRKTKQLASKPLSIPQLPPATVKLVDQALQSVVALLPERKQRHALYNGLVLAGAIFTLAALAGSAGLPMLLGSTKEAMASRPPDINIEREIDRVVAEGRPLFDNLPLIVATLPPGSQLPKSEIKRDAIAPIKTEVKSEPPKPEVKREAALPAVTTEQQQSVARTVESKPETKTETKTEAKPETKSEVKSRAKASRRNPGQAALGNKANGLDALASAAVGNDLIAEAKKYLGGNPTGRARDWCGAFLDMVLRRTGHRGGGNLARGYINYGKRLAGPQVGAIVVFSRIGGGHVGIVTGVDANGNPIVISGNHNKRVAVATYPARRVLAYVSPGG